MSIREHANMVWAMLRRWPRRTAIAIGALALAYFLYYAGVEVMSIPAALLAALGMALMTVSFKVVGQFLFYRFFHYGEFAGSFFLLAAMAAVPFVAALAISMLLAPPEVSAPPADAMVLMLLGAGGFFVLTLGGAARLFYWLGGQRR
jgi:hypothetical protein